MTRSQNPSNFFRQHFSQHLNIIAFAISSCGDALILVADQLGNQGFIDTLLSELVGYNPPVVGICYVNDLKWVLFVYCQLVMD